MSENPDPRKERYERYLAEKTYLKSLEKRIASNSKYQKFYEEGKFLNYNDFAADSEEKRRLLEKYYPRFRKNGKQPIYGYDDLQVGALFKKMIIYAEEVTNQ